MKERPILMSAPMVRALLAGTKTQTRRAIKPQPAKSECVIRPFNDQRLHYAARDPHDMEQGLLMLGEVPLCPYGQPGDHLWVRETWQAISGDRQRARIMKFPAPPVRGWMEYAATPSDEPPPRWRPSIHMPRWASRITLEITEVRVERLQDISEADALAEGAPGTWIDRVDDGMGFRPNRNGPAVQRFFFRKLWERINGSGSWDANPWVWVLSFMRLQHADRP